MCEVEERGSFQLFTYRTLVDPTGEERERERGKGKLKYQTWEKRTVRLPLLFPLSSLHFRERERKRERAELERFLEKSFSLFSQVIIPFCFFFFFNYFLIL